MTISTTAFKVCYLIEKQGQRALEFVSRREALKAVAKHGIHVRTKEAMSLYYYVAEEDDWLRADIKKGSNIELAGSRPNLMPPFSSVQNFLKAIGHANPHARLVRHYFDRARAEGKFPWVQEPYAVQVHSGSQQGRWGVVPLLELLYAVKPEAFTFLESLGRYSPETIAALFESVVC